MTEEFEVYVDSVAYVEAETKEKAERKAMKDKQKSKDIVEAHVPKDEVGA